MKVVKNGVKRTGRQKFLCHCCGKLFQLYYHKSDYRREIK
ncbi:IS1/IS1595 family N-terminal zinc-binding domain-containing protein [Pontibacter sp. 13R65]